MRTEHDAMLREQSRPVDSGSILPVVLVVTVVLSLVVVAIATYAATDLRYGQVVEARAGRIAAAQGAVDDMLESLTISNQPLCVTTGSTGVDIPFPEQVNGADVVVNCRTAGTTLPAPEGWALVITAEGAPADTTPVFDIGNGGDVRISGPVFVETSARVRFKPSTTIVDGDFWYPDDTCSITDPANSGIQFQPSTSTPPYLGFSPSRGAVCINRHWNELFTIVPTISPDVATYTADTANWNPPPVIQGTCRVFSPGYYNGLFDISSSNYFKSGNYVFDDIGKMTLGDSVATFGNVVRQGYPAIGNTACDAARLADTAGGATIYTKGNTQFEMNDNGGLDVSGRKQGASVVALQVLDTSLSFSTPYAADNGDHEQVAFHGIVWAPYSSFRFVTVPNGAAAMLRGGAVLASFVGKPQNATTFLIEMATTDAHAQLIIDATATDTSGSSTVRAVVDFRPSTGEAALASRRLMP